MDISGIIIPIKEKYLELFEKIYHKDKAKLIFFLWNNIGGILNSAFQDFNNNIIDTYVFFSFSGISEKVLVYAKIERCITVKDQTGLEILNDLGEHLKNDLSDELEIVKYIENDSQENSNYYRIINDNDLNVYTSHLKDKTIYSLVCSEITVLDKDEELLIEDEDNILLNKWGEVEVCYLNSNMTNGFLNKLKKKKTLKRKKINVGSL